MITNTFINIAYSGLNWLIESLPNSTGFNSEIHTAFSTLGGYVGMLDVILPMTTLAACIGLVFSVEIGIFGFKTIKWVMSHVPFIGGKG